MRKRILAAADRLQTISIPAGTFTYTYKGPGTVWTNLALPTSPSAAITNAFDTGGRLTTTRLKNNAGTILNKHDYLYNGGGQRQRQTRTDSSYTTYSYDDDAQLATSLGYTSGGTPVTAEQLGFVYDPGWNLTNRAVNGAGTTYGVDVRNQLTAIGSASYGYDANGNLTTETGAAGRIFSYDEENRLISVQWGAGNYRTEFAYDGLSRMRKRTEKYYTAGNWTVTGSVLHVTTFNLCRAGIGVGSRHLTSQSSLLHNGSMPCATNAIPTAV